MAKRSTSTLHLQMGQEVIYLLLTSSLFATIILLAFINSVSPPIIRLDEADGYSFPSGSAVLSEAFETRLRDDVAERVRQYAQTFGADIIEIVGHTDEVTLRRSGPASNLDASLLPYLFQSRPVELMAQDNVGLGMARAVAVARVLREAGLDQDFQIIPLSAGQLVMPGDVVADGSRPGNDAGRRRIEIRVRKKPEYEQSN